MKYENTIEQAKDCKEWLVKGTKNFNESSNTAGARSLPENCWWPGDKFIYKLSFSYILFAFVCSLCTMWLNWHFSQSSHLHEKDNCAFIIWVAEIWLQQGENGLPFLDIKCSYWQWAEIELLTIFCWITKYLYIYFMYWSFMLVFSKLIFHPGSCTQY